MLYGAGWCKIVIFLAIFLELQLQAISIYNGNFNGVKLRNLKTPVSGSEINLYKIIKIKINFNYMLEKIGLFNLG